MRHFDGKTIAVWGCGALGLPSRSGWPRGVSRLILYDKASVARASSSPAVHHAAIGYGKAEILADACGRSARRLESRCTPAT